MTAVESNGKSVFAWNAGGWFGTQIGSTLWLLILGTLLLARDSVTAWACLAGFFALNGWGWHLWRRRRHCGPHAALQRFLALTTAVIAGVVALVNARGLSEPPAPGALVSTQVPYWIVGIAPVLMLVFYLRERGARRGTP